MRDLGCRRIAPAFEPGVSVWKSTGAFVRMTNAGNRLPPSADCSASGQEVQQMTSMEILRLLTFSGSFAILVSCLLGFAMLIPLQPWGRKVVQSVNFRQVRAAHLDWIMLGLMQGLAGALIWTFSLQPSPFIVWALIFGSWVNPLSYLFRAFGINAFAFDGGAIQRFSAALGGVSSAALFLAWASLIHLAWLTWQ